VLGQPVCSSSPADTPWQIADLKLRDEWADKCVPTGGSRESPDPIGKRNGRAPVESMAALLKKTSAEARAAVGPRLVQNNMLLTTQAIQEQLDQLRGAVTIVYPMGLPPHEDVRVIIDEQDDLSSTQSGQLVLEDATAQLWWAGKELMRDRKLADYVGKNDKTKIIAKLQKRGGGAPMREPAVDEQTKAQLMSHFYRKQEEMKKLEAESDEAYLSAAWADPSALRRQINGLDSVGWRPR
jgi:cilia- and flagella-associated protein 298